MGEQTVPSAAIAKEKLCCLFSLGIFKLKKKDPGLGTFAQPRIAKTFWPLFNQEVLK